MKRMIICFVTVLAAIWSVLGVTVTNVRGEQRQGSKLVDIYYDLNSTDGGTYTVEVVLEGDTETVQAVSLTGDIGKGVKPGKNHHIVWDAGVDWVSRKGYIKAVVTAEKEGAQGVQLWEGGPYWADRNIGADEPWEYGYYFWWGDTVGYKLENNKWVASDGANSNFSFNGSNFPTYNKSASTLQSEGWITAEGVLASEHDAAHIHWGGGWRMPTKQEIDDLNNKCNWIWTTMNGVNGYIVRGRDKYAPNSIFLPCAGLVYGTSFGFSGSSGFYWSSVPYSDSHNALYLYFDSGSHYTGFSSRGYGWSVRPVQGFAK